KRRGAAPPNGGCRFTYNGHGRGFGLCPWAFRFKMPGYLNRTGVLNIMGAGLPGKGERPTVSCAPKDVNLVSTGQHILNLGLVQLGAVLGAPHQKFAIPAVGIVVPGSASGADIAEYVKVAV